MKKRAIVALMLAAVATVPYRAATEPITLGVSGRFNANVSMAADGAFVALAWSASLPSGLTDIYVSTSRDSGGAFSAPSRVNSTAGDARVNGEQPPRVALATRPGALPAISVVWTSKDDVGTTLLTARSEDGGRTFSKTALVPGGRAAGNRGWENIAVDPRGETRVVWLDHREMAQAEAGTMSGMAAHAGHDPSAAAKKDGVAMAQQSKLYVATVGDPASVRVVTGGVCYCCKTAIVSDARGALYTAWRHVFPGNLRDIAFSVSRDGGKNFAAPIRVSEDKWQLEGCPDDGPAMTLDGQDRIHILWPTLVADGPGGQPSIGIFYAQSRDGRTFSPRQRIATEGTPHHPQMAAGNGMLYLAWDEVKNGKRQIVAASRSLDGAPAAALSRSVISGTAPGVYPVVAYARGGALAAWSSGGSDDSVIRVARVP